MRSGCRRGVGPIVSRARRRSPAVFDLPVAEVERRDGWNVVLRYENEGRNGDSERPPLCAAQLVDLSHRRRWDFQDGNLGDHRPLGLPIPSHPGQVAHSGPFVVNRMNRTQVAIWHLGQGPVRAAAPDPAPTPPTLPSPPSPPGLTETTDGHCMLAFVGSGVPTVLEHLTPLDLFDPARNDPARDFPFLTQGPVLRVPCQIVTFARDLVVMTLARGHGETFAAAALASGGPAGLTLAGELAFTTRFHGPSHGH